MAKFYDIPSNMESFVDPLSKQFINSELDVSIGIDIANISLDSDSGTTRSKKFRSSSIAVTKDQSYIEEWTSICRCASSSNFIKYAMDGQLGGCRFRSVCWRVFLGTFSSHSSKWLSILRNKREKYERSRLKLMVTPESNNLSLDPNVNNPLSQDEQSPWNQYFEDSELKKLIRLDVQRTFPELDFFQLPRIQEMLVSILFCYARNHPELSYMQGMHEVLAPLAYVVHNDIIAYQKANGTEEIPNLLMEMMDSTYMEHDVSSLFESVMRRLHHWYDDGDTRRNIFIPKTKVIPSQPFAKEEVLGPTTKIAQQLSRVHNEFLSKYQPEIFLHLNEFEIAPQVYGIRWARLIFGREFPLSDVLLLWDAIFADTQPKFQIMEYIMVALLANIKDSLLSSDYIKTLNLLMRYPINSDILSIIQTALHYRNPEKYSLPSVIYGRQYGYAEDITFNFERDSNLTGLRSSSVPRPHSTSSHSRHRSTSGEQGRSFSDRRKSDDSPTVLTVQPSIVSFHKPSHKPSFRSYLNESLPNNIEKISSSNSQFSEEKKGVVSTLVRFGERLSRPKELVLNGSSQEIPKDRPMSELSFVARSPPIATTNSIDGSSQYSYDDFGESKGLAVVNDRRNSDELSSLNLNCALELSHHHAALSTRLSQLNMDADLVIRVSMEGIYEVVETLRTSKLPKKNRDIEFRKNNYSEEATNSKHKIRNKPRNFDEYCDKDENQFINSPVVMHPLMGDLDS